MTTHSLRSPRWNTASIADATDTSPMELVELGAHIDRCNGCRGRWFALRCVADAVHDFVAPRFVTTLLAAAVVLGLAAIAL
ncbi:MAG: zf-TFIIB domain-containing protein [Burkholderiales bacterium]